MTFNSLTFVLFFLLFYSGYLLLYQLEKHHAAAGSRCRLLYILTASAIFYGWWDWRFLFLIFFTGTVDFCVAQLMVRCEREWVRKLLLAVSLISGTGVLAIFKYSAFLAGCLTDLAARFGINHDFAGDIPEFCLILPVGISFYTFQSLSYTIDVYRKQLVPTGSIIHFFSYLMLFPQLVAGPIVRAKMLLPQLLKKPAVSPVMTFTGIKLIAAGFFKKCVIADNAAIFVNLGFANIPGVADTVAWWLLMVLFALQIYCDFSGYSDIARGLIKLMGYRFDLNFNHPELAYSMKNFWERWHISLSSWFRDYVYIPLGGSRGGKYPAARGVVNMFITMLLSGLWHGAAWNFVFWGMFHGLALAVERVSNWGKFVQKGIIQRLTGVLVTQTVVLLAWVFFRARSFNDAVAVYYRMFHWQSGKVDFISSNSGLIITLLILFAGIEYITAFRPERYLKRFLPVNVYRGCEYLFTVMLLLSAIYFKGDGDVFIYFQF